VVVVVVAHGAMMDAWPSPGEVIVRHARQLFPSAA
jgi:hypothetical protein